MTTKNAVKALVIIGAMLGAHALMKSNIHTLIFSGVWSALLLLVYLYYEGND